jgi:hypothetical protein
MRLRMRTIAQANSRNQSFGYEVLRPPRQPQDDKQKVSELLPSPLGGTRPLQGGLRFRSVGRVASGGFRLRGEAALAAVGRQG